MKNNKVSYLKEILIFLVTLLSIGVGFTWYGVNNLPPEPEVEVHYNKDGSIQIDNEDLPQNTKELERGEELRFKILSYTQQQHGLYALNSKPTITILFEDNVFTFALSDYNIDYDENLTSIEDAYLYAYVNNSGSFGEMRISQE